MGTRRQFIESVTARLRRLPGRGATARAWWHRGGGGRSQHNRAPAGRHRIEGGNDGLNTVVPYTDDLYYKARPSLGIPDKVLKLNDQLGMHPAMKPWQKFWDGGQLAIVENCGYPNPNRSHFESMDIWHAGQLDSASRPAGWAARPTRRGRRIVLRGRGRRAARPVAPPASRCVARAAGRFEVAPEAADVDHAAATGDDLAAAVAERYASPRTVGAAARCRKAIPPPEQGGRWSIGET